MSSSSRFARLRGWTIASGRRVPLWEKHSERHHYGPFVLTYAPKSKKWVVFMRDTEDPPLIKVGQVGKCDTLDQAKALAEATYTLGEEHENI